MKYYFELNGRKLEQSECYSYNEIYHQLHDVLDQCVKRYRECYRYDATRSELIRLQEKILARIRIVRVDTPRFGVKFKASEAEL